MNYLGSKLRIVNKILPIILQYKKRNQIWIEPFVGGANVIEHIIGERIGNDINKYLIALFQSIQKGWIPPTKICEELYHDVNYNKDRYDDCLVGFIGFCCSFGGKFFGGYARNEKYRNYALVGCKNLLKQRKYIDGVKFVNYDYRDLPIPPNSLIYCDPPYFKLTKYKYEINYNEFWNWCREKNNNGHTVFISESTAPDDFECLLEIKQKCTMNHNTIKQEKIFYERLFKQKKEV